MTLEPAAPTRPARQAGPALYASVPTRSRLFWRTFVPWQLWRFVWINLKMFRIIAKSHAGTAAADRSQHRK